MQTVAQSYWWQLGDREREYLERAVDHIIYTLCWGNRQTVISLIQEAYRRGLDKTPLQSAVLWLLREKVDQDD
jgi:hypothetical protein